MALSLSILDGHMARVFTDFPLTVYWQGLGIAAIRSTPSLSQTLEVGGPDEKVEFDLFVRRSECPRVPREGDIFDVAKIKMKVLTVKNATETGDLLSLGMGFAGQGDYP